LTARASRLLAPRFADLSIELSHPKFEKEWRKLWLEMAARQALKGGTALLKMMFQGDYLAPDEARLATMRQAIRHRGRDKEDPTEFAQTATPGSIARVFEYDSHKAMRVRSNGDIDYLKEFGRFVREGLGDEADQCTAFTALLNAVKSVGHEGVRELPEILARADIRRALDALSHLPFTTNLAVLAIFVFLKWRFASTQSQCPDLKDLRREAARLAKAVGSRIVAEAIWLFGCFVGHDGLVPEIFAMDAERYTFCPAAASARRIEFAPDPFASAARVEIDPATDAAAAHPPAGVPEVGREQRPSPEPRSENQTSPPVPDRSNGERLDDLETPQKQADFFPDQVASTGLESRTHPVAIRSNEETPEAHEPPMESPVDRKGEMADTTPPSHDDAEIAAVDTQSELPNSPPQDEPVPGEKLASTEASDQIPESEVPKKPKRRRARKTSKTPGRPAPSADRDT